MIEVRDPVHPGAALAAGKKVGPDAINLLMQDHRQVLFYFDAYEAANELGRAELERMIRLNLLTHMAIEEEIFYPAAQGLTGDEELVGESYDEHDEAKEMLERLASASAEEKLSLIRELKEAILEHIEAEEGVLFPKLREAGLDGVSVGMAMAARRPEVLSVLTGKPIPMSGLGQNAEGEPKKESPSVH